MSRYPNPADIDFSTGFDTVPSYVAIVTHSIFFNLLIFIIFVLIASGYWVAKRDAFAALATASFIAWFFSTIFWIGGLVTGWTFGVCTAFAVIFFTSLWMERSD